MAGSVNKVILVGNLGQDPEIRRLPSGDPVVNLRIATSENWRDKNSGERKEKTEWHSVVIFNENLAKVAEQYLKKGAKVYIEGQLQTRQWEDQSGQKRYSTEVVLQRFRGELQMLDSARRGGGEMSATAAAAAPNSAAPSPMERNGRGSERSSPKRWTTRFRSDAATHRRGMSLEPLLRAAEPIPIHAFAAIAAFALGLVQFAAPKGTLPHRTIGWIWVGLMATVALSSLWIHTIRVWGPWSPIRPSLNLHARDPAALAFCMRTGIA